uniref:Solute carrier family 12 member 1 n=1 Tax=Plectus sambesii TaxID=2011161 RepID=A0A914WCB5_9BILA
MWLSLGGALLCLTVMFIISWWTALVTFLFFAMFFLYVLHRKPEVNWGSSTQAHSYKSALQAMLKLTTIEEHVKNFRPQLLVLTGNPAARPSLVDFVNNITKGSSLMICGHVIPYAPSDRVFSCIRKLDRQLNEWLHKRHVKAFYVSTANASVRAGVQTLLHLAGLGKLRPNIVIIGFKGNWAEDGADGLDEINEYFGIIQDSFDSNMGVGIMRNAGGGLDYSELMKEHNVGDTTKLKLPDVNAPLTAKSSVDLQTSDHGLTGESSALLSPVHELSKEDLARGGSIKPDLSESASSFAEKFPFLEEGAVEDVEDEEETFDVSPTAEEDHKENRTSPDGNGSTTDSPLRRLSLRARRPTAAQRDLVASINRFQRKIKSAVVDVWWLYDDGGLTLLIPHLLTVPKSYLENAKMRVFTIASSRSAIEQEQRSMAALLSKFRIEFTDVFVIPDIAKRPSPSTLAEWEQLIAPFRVDDDSGNHGEGLISPAELTAHKERTYRQLRCRELLLDHSSQANLVVMTLPVPRKGIINSCLYMAWLEMLTRDLPPTLLIRGNQTSVLTFYS